MDFKLKHVLGNLLDSDYTSLFQGEGFSKVKNGLKDDKKDILCRYCENACDISGLAKLYNPLIRRINKLASYCLRR